MNAAASASLNLCNLLIRLYHQPHMYLRRIFIALFKVPTIFWVRWVLQMYLQLFLRTLKLSQTEVLLMLMVKPLQNYQHHVLCFVRFVRRSVNNNSQSRVFITYGMLPYLICRLGCMFQMIEHLLKFLMK